MTSHTYSSPWLKIHAMARLKHPNLVRVVGMCTDNNPATGMKERIVIYEFISGGDLAAFLEGRGSGMSYNTQSVV